MIWWYTAALILGFGFIIPMLFAGYGSDGIDSVSEIGSAGPGDVGDFDLDLDLDVDSGPFSDISEMSSEVVETGSALSGPSELLSSVLSFRSAIFASGFFGLAGLLFSWAGRNEPIPVLMASFFAVLAALGNGYLYRFITNSEADSFMKSDDLFGKLGSVVIPVTFKERGRIKVEAGSETIFMTAQSFEVVDTFDLGDEVVVVEVRDGVALISAFDRHLYPKLKS